MSDAVSSAPISKELVELARRHTRGEASPRRHQASRARVLDQLVQRRGPSGAAIALAALVVVGGGGAAFAGVKAFKGTEHPSVTIGKGAPPTANGNANANEDGDDSPTTPSESAPSQPATTAPEVKIGVQPEHAAIYWDDKKLEDNPTSFAMKPDHKPHRIRAEAPGYVTKTQLVMMDSETVDIELELTPVPITIGPLLATASIVDADTIVETLRHSFQSCYVEALVAAPALAGKVTLVTHIEANGDVANVEIAEREGLSAKVTSCLASAASEFVHYRTTGLAGTVRIPLAFRTK